MPRYLKDTKLHLWRTAPDFQDESGGWHRGRAQEVAALWANVKGVDSKILYGSTGEFPADSFEATVTRPSHVKIRLGDHVKRGSAYYRISAINELTGRPRTDMRILCEVDPEFPPLAAV